MTLEDSQDGHVTQGVGGEFEMVCDQKLLSFVVNGAQVLYKAVSQPPFGFTDVEEATLGAVDAVDHIDECAGEPLSDVKVLFGALNGGEGGGAGTGVECPIIGTEAAEAEELGVGDRILVG
eukprot:g27669.t1